MENKGTHSGIHYYWQLNIFGTQCFRNIAGVQVLSTCLFYLSDFCYFPPCLRITTHHVGLQVVLLSSKQIPTDCTKRKVPLLERMFFHLLSTCLKPWSLSNLFKYDVKEDAPNHAISATQHLVLLPNYSLPSMTLSADNVLCSLLSYDIYCLLLPCSHWECNFCKGKTFDYFYCTFLFLLCISSHLNYPLYIVGT